MSFGLNPMKSSRLRFSIACLLCFSLGAGSCVAQSSSTPPRVPPRVASASEPAHKLSLAGVPNFGQITETLYRGGQPTAEGFRALRRLGIEIVINLRDEPDERSAEQRQVEALGMRYVGIPWNASHDPTSYEVAEFLESVRANPGRKTLVHCHYGADRTGVMVATFRMAMQNWTPQQAFEEMKEFHFHNFLHHHLKAYVEGFPRQLETDPALRALHRAPVAPP